MNINIYKGFILLSLLMTACSKSETNISQKLEATELANVAYGSHGRQKVDVYLPQNRSTDTKILVLLHGGFWMQGDKADVSPYARYFQEKGYAVLAVNYRLTNTAENNIHPAQINDIKLAVSFASSKATEWKVSGDQFGILGASAGGHLGLLYSYGYNSDRKVKTVVAVAAPTNLTDPRNTRPEMAAVVAWLIGSPIQSSFAKYQEASPISHVNATSTPTLIVHGRNDTFVPVHQATDLQAKLQQLNVPNKVLLYQGGHEVITSQNQAEFLVEAENWLKEYLK